MEETNKKNKNLIIILITIILILSGVICYFIFDLGKNTPNINDETNTNNELSLTDTMVEKIIDKFYMDYKDEFYMMDPYNYVYELLKEEDILELTRLNAEKFIKIEENCDVDEPENNIYTNEEEEIFYWCKHIKYEDLNKSYNNIVGKDLPKENILSYYYDKDKDIFRIMGGVGSSGFEDFIISKIEKAEKENDYIYIYEKVIIVRAFDDDTTYLAKPSEYGPIFNDYNAEINQYLYEDYKEDDENNEYTFEDRVIEKYIDKFETYKWTFKTNSNGEYVFVSLSREK